MFISAYSIIRYIHILSPLHNVLRERAGVVGSASDFGPRGPRFDPRPRRRLLWPQQIVYIMFLNSRSKGSI